MLSSPTVTYNLFYIIGLHKLVSYDDRNTTNNNTEIYINNI